MDGEKVYDHEDDLEGTEHQVVREYTAEYADGSALLLREWSDGEMMISRKTAYSSWFPLRVSADDMKRLVAAWVRWHGNDYNATDPLNTVRWPGGYSIGTTQGYR